jgi:transporter family-2 protein
MSKVYLVILMIFAGCMAGIQSSINGALGKRIGVYESSFFSFLLGTIILLVLVVVLGKGNLSAVTEVPRWQLLGGVAGVIIVTSMILAVPNIGVASAVFAVTIGQILISMVIDHFGLFDAPVIPFNLLRFAGIILMVAGLILIFRGGNLTSS